MHYRHAPAADYSDYASGGVLRSAPGHPGFPVRLGSELYQRAAALLDRRDRLTVWDPCCGSGQLITTLGLLHGAGIGELIASDADSEVLPLVRKNLALLSRSGLAARRTELVALAERHGKESHTLAVAAADRLLAEGVAVGTRAEQADVFDRPTLDRVIAGATVDVVIADLPYGQQTSFHGGPAEQAVDEVLANLADVLPEHAVVVLVMAGRRLPRGSFRAQETVRAGTRVAGIYSAAG